MVHRGGWWLTYFVVSFGGLVIRIMGIVESCATLAKYWKSGYITMCCLTFFKCIFKPPQTSYKWNTNWVCGYVNMLLYISHDCCQSAAGLAESYAKALSRKQPLMFVIPSRSLVISFLLPSVIITSSQEASLLLSQSVQCTDAEGQICEYFHVSQRITFRHDAELS